LTTDLIIGSLCVQFFRADGAASYNFTVHLGFSQQDCDGG